MQKMHLFRNNIVEGAGRNVCVFSLLLYTKDLISAILLNWRPGTHFTGSRVLLFYLTVLYLNHRIEVSAMINTYWRGFIHMIKLFTKGSGKPKISWSLKPMKTPLPLKMLTAHARSTFSHSPLNILVKMTNREALKMFPLR